jgi:hypothetical protein
MFKKNRSFFLSLGLYVFVSLFLLINYYFDLLLPLIQGANALYQGLVSGVPQKIVPLLLQFIPMILFFSFVYILFFSVFWFVLSNTKRISAVDSRLFIVGVALISIVVLLLFQRISAFVQPLLLYTIGGVLIGGVCLYMYSGKSPQFFGYLKYFSVHSVIWVTVYFFLLLLHFLFSGVVYFFIRIDPYLTSWKYVLISLIWLINIFVLQGVLYTHAIRSREFFSSRKNSFKILLPRLIHMLYVFGFFLVLQLFDYGISFVPFDTIISFIVYASALSFGAVWYSSYLLVKHEIKS